MGMPKTTDSETPAASMALTRECEVQKMQVGINNVVSWLCFHPADINVAIIDHGKPPLVNLSFSISIITVVEPVKNKKRQAVICK